ncbi:MAG: serine/threonine protein kinase [Planctomycetaceae bacterium]|nr:serine/threonine protein kinase [Planctomycetaceae bacterium]
MTSNDNNRTQQLVSPYSEQIDEVCDDFEAAWQRGSRIRMENCLRLVPDAARGELLRELLEIEIEIRVQLGESVLFEQYATRFPEHVDVIQAVLQRHTGRRRLGDYELLEQLGRGGMGIVYKARQVWLNQIVAIKILPEQYVGDEHALSRFRREMQLIGGLRHPNIVQAYNAGEADGMHFLVMEYVAGVTLQRLIAEMAAKHYDERGEMTPTLVDLTDAELLESERPHTESGLPSSEGGLPISERQHDRPEIGHRPDGSQPKALTIAAACEAIRQAAMGLHHAHQRGLVHRDIKPGNLMLDRHGLIKVLDLGLGKFQADVLHGDHSIGPLTQAGTTMGTVDYMAPEQWDDPTTVDIRADIYSLGNTLYFLLCGGPPFDGKNYASNRAKLLAHIVAEPPSLQNACPGVPPELEQVYLKLVAKEPQDRYQTPLEAAEALAPFADADALREAIPLELKRVSDADRATSSEYQHSAGRDTVAYPYSPSRRRRITELAPTPKPWYRHQGFYASVALCSVALLIVAIGLASRFGRNNPEPPVDPGSNGAGYQLRYDATERDAIIADLLELPGLSGQTWFFEMPWLTPFVRQAAAGMLSQTTEPETLLGKELKGYLDPDTVKVQEWLWTLTEKTLARLTPPQRQLVKDLKDLADSNLELDDHANRMIAALETFNEANTGLPRRAVDVHTAAALWHTLSGLKVDKDLAGFANSAKEHYQDALDIYGSDEISQRLKLLCMTDMARLVGQTLNDYDKSGELYNEVRNSDLVTVLLKADAQISLGIDRASQGQYTPFLFSNSESLLKGIKIDPNHPMFAHIAERHAWCLIDLWQVDNAKTQFSLALSIRDTNSRSGQNPFANIYSLHNTHGLAMSERYRGDPAESRKNYDNVIRDIEKKLAGDETRTASSNQQQSGQLPGQLRYFNELRERLTNSRYRRADCELFGGAASGDRDIEYVKAEQLYEQSMRTTNDRATQVGLSVKLCLIRALRGKVDEANALLDELDEAISTIVSPVAQFRAQQFSDTVRGIVAVCGAECAMKTSEPPPDALAAYEQAIDGLRKQLQILTANQQNETLVERYEHNRPEMLEFRLFCLEFLLNAEKKCATLAGRETLSKSNDVKLLRETLSVFNDKPDMMPYARRYYDLAIQVADKFDPSERIALLQANMGTPPDFLPGRSVNGKALEAWQLLFHFSPTGDADTTGNFVILKPDSSQPSTCQPLTHTRAQIKESANLGQEITPQPELQEILERAREAREAGYIVNIFWNDRRCWAHEKDALTDHDWPFESLLPLRDKPEQKPE